MAQIKQCPLCAFKEEVLTCGECALHKVGGICNVWAESLTPCGNLLRKCIGVNRSGILGVERL